VLPRLTVAWSDVVDDRALVAVRPSVPVEGQLRASSYIRVKPGSCRTLVTVDIVSAQGGRLDEAKVLVQRVPTSSLGPRIRWGVVPHRIGTLGPDVVGSDAAYEAVRRCGVEQSGDSAEDEYRRKHLEARGRESRKWRDWRLVMISLGAELPLLKYSSLPQHRHGRNRQRRPFSRVANYNQALEEPQHVILGGAVPMRLVS
jgi:hypothetical protein